MGTRKDINAADHPLDLGAAPPGAYGRPQQAEPPPRSPPPGEEVEDMGALNPVFAWFEGGDVIQFGNLCPSCPPDVKNECRLWRLETLDGVAAKEPRNAHDCLFFIKWSNERPARENLTGEEKEEGKSNLSSCPSCGRHATTRWTRPAGGSSA